MMFLPLYSSTQPVARAELSRPRRFILFRLGTVWQFFLRAMKMILLGPAVGIECTRPGFGRTSPRALLTAPITPWECGGSRLRYADNPDSHAVFLRLDPEDDGDRHEQPRFSRLFSFDAW